MLPILTANGIYHDAIRRDATARRIRRVCATLFALFSFAGTCAADDAPRPSAAEVRGAYDSGTVFVDVRTNAEWSAGHLKDARHLALDQVAAEASTVLPPKNEPVVLYCGTGRRAQSAAEQLRQLGYEHVTAMTGGYADLKAAGFPVVE